MAGVICLHRSDQPEILNGSAGLGGLPTEHRTDEEPTEVAFVVQRVEVLRHHVSPVWVGVIVWPFGDGCGSWELRHLLSIVDAGELELSWGSCRALISEELQPDKCIYMHAPGPFHVSRDGSLLRSAYQWSFGPSQ